MQTRNEAHWQVLATAWEFAALSFRYPDTTLAEIVSSGEWEETATEIADVLGFSQAFDTASHEGEDPESLLHTLRAEATRLFIGTPTPVTSPYEGVWRATADGVQPLLFVNPHSMDVERFMRSVGLTRPDGTNEPLDHIATEAEMLSYLGSIASGIATLPEGVDEASFPGGSAAAAYDSFIEEHIRTWTQDFISALKEETSLDYYRAAATYLEGLVYI